MSQFIKVSMDSQILLKMYLSLRRCVATVFFFSVLLLFLIEKGIKEQSLHMLYILDQCVSYIMGL